MATTSLKVKDLLPAGQHVQTLQVTDTVAAALALFQAHKLTSAPVLGPSGNFEGTFFLFFHAHHHPLAYS